MMTDHSTTAPSGATVLPDAFVREVISAQDTLARVSDLNRLLSLAGEGLHFSEPDVSRAIMVGCDLMGDLLDQVRVQLTAVRGEGAGGEE